MITRHERHLRYYSKNRDKILQKQAQYAARNGDRLKQYHIKYHLKYKYNLTHNEYIELISNQEGRCAICREKPSRLCIDHNHSTGEIRGLLCDNCNKALGLMRDSQSRLQLAIDYLNERERKI